MSTEKDFDPVAVPIQPAATVMIVDDRPDLQVLLIKRNAKMVFAGGMWVFPGGRVDPGEADDFEPHCEGMNDAEASRIMGMESGGLAYWVAAIRENFEEVGLLLGQGRDGSPIDTMKLEGDRDRLNSREANFLQIVRAHGLHLETSGVHYVAHWITPLGGPRRFSARFFVTRPPAGQIAQPDENETVGWDWMAPRKALERFDRGEITMMSPTVRMLRSLALFDSAEHVIEAATSNLPDERVRVNYLSDGDYTIVMPGEPGYEEGDEDKENGWVRLRPIR